MTDRTDSDKMKLTTYESVKEKQQRGSLVDLLKSSPIPQDQILSNLGLFLDSKHLARILFMNHLFQQIQDVQGVVMEFGTHWGNNMGVFSALRGIYDPFNRHRKIVGFDTFTGFPSITKQDGKSDLMKEGNLMLPEGYANFLSAILSCHEQLNPLAHIKKYEIRVGDATKEVPRYFTDHPETIIALAYFDFDLYEPTKIVLEQIRSRLTRGSVIAFDELNDPDSPGETLALMETFGLNTISLKRFPHTSRTSYFVLD